MTHVLKILAFLHHDGMIPESVYKFDPAKDPLGLRQPPILHTLASRIMAVLADASFNDHGPAPKHTKFSLLGAPVSQYRAPELRTEVWLELVLWSCLHGGWIEDGSWILSKMTEYTGDDEWSVVCWQHIVKSSGLDQSAASTISSVKLNSLAHGTRPLPGEKSPVELRISSELISAYVDGLISTIGTGSDTYGTAVTMAIGDIKKWKSLLDKENLGLGYATWDAIVLRIVESEELALQEDPSLLLDLLTLAQPVGWELEALNSTTPNDTSVPSYVYKPSAAMLGLHHRVIQAYVNSGAVEGALGAFYALQLYTDLNKRRSIERFFRTLKEIPEGSQLEAVSFTSSAPAVEHPGYDPQMPPHLLGSFLDLLVANKKWDICHWLVDSKDPDGPIIPTSLYSERALGPALIRFGSATRRKELVGHVLQQLQIGEDISTLPSPVLEALLESQIRAHRWGSVENILSSMASAQLRWCTRSAIVLVREILRLQKGVISKQAPENKKPLADAISIFRRLLCMSYGQPASERSPDPTLEDPFTVLHTVIGILSSIDSDWAAFCADLRFRRGNRPLTIPTPYFDTILDGVIDAFGLDAGRRLWDTWCLDPADEAEIARTRGERISRAEGYFSGMNRVILDDLPDEGLQFYGRIKPSLNTFRTIMSGDDDTAAASRDLPREQLVQWVASKFRTANISESEVRKELERLTRRRIAAEQD
ncbi:hypothetical protein EJ06DRAFT_558200 [Trichodelitschia bisporula]|uniref:Uncharacterized protein n=1 Tax=Trichodelitschia bisporula TaxID=703511 RepID=A0A6G1HQT0_9PEZI|nr:hypothetical protein EJ06DRAFT_558200 [Trichodelitschia bisporula]